MSEKRTIKEILTEALAIASMEGIISNEESNEVESWRISVEDALKIGEKIGAKVFVVTRRGYYGSPCRDKSRVAFDLEAVFSTREKAMEYINKQMHEEQAEYLYHVSEMEIDTINRKELVMLQTTLYGLRTYPEGWGV
jgi:hypothetical protein